MNHHNYKKKVKYFAYFNRLTLPGVEKKIDQTLSAIKKLNYDVYLVIKSERNLRSHWAFFGELFKTDADTIIIRNVPHFMIFLLPVLIWNRLKGVKVIIEIPTPITIILNEISMKNDGKIRKYLKLAVMYISFPLALYPANRIIEYAGESRYFSLGLNKKMMLLTNGIDVDNITARLSSPAWPAKEFTLIGVASLASWHAFDRVIHGIYSYKNKHSNEKIKLKLIVVGDGEVRKELVKLSQSLRVEDSVEFVGFQIGENLDELFNRSHVAVSSLGLYRIGLDMGSVLKSREYTARGMPFISTGYDIDFDPIPSFVLQVKNDNTPVNIEEVIAFYTSIYTDKNLSDKIRSYAVNNLDLKVKVARMLS